MLKELCQEEMENMNGGLRTSDYSWNTYLYMLLHELEWILNPTPEPTTEPTPEPSPEPTSGPTGPTYSGPDYSDPSSPPYPV